MGLQYLINAKNEINRTKYFCFFGIGHLLNDCYNQIVSFIGREPDFFCDNAREKWGADFFGKTCISPEELAGYANDVLVLITIKKYEKICVQLNNMGIEGVFVACYDRCYNYLRTVKQLEIDHFTVSTKEKFINSVEGKWTLITGAARGIGRQIAVEMARLGSNVIVHGRSVSHLNEVIGLCSGFGVNIVPVAAEFTNLSEVETMLSDLDRLVPQVDIIFNNAGISLPSLPGFWSTPVQDYLTTYTVNTVVPLYICQKLIPPMISRGFGRVINISSSIQKRPNEISYACSKAALDKFVHDLVPAINGTGVMLTLVDPGWIKTDMGTAWGGQATCSVESVTPGALLGALLDGNINGWWFGAQDYAGLTIEEAVQKAKYLFL